MRVTTTYKTNANGTGQIVAKTSGGSPSWLDGEYRPRQRTITRDPARSSAQNHGDAAGILLRTMGVGEVFPDVPITHDSSEDGTRHTFTL